MSIIVEKKHSFAWYYDNHPEEAKAVLNLIKHDFDTAIVMLAGLNIDIEQTVRLFNNVKEGTVSERWTNAKTSALLYYYLDPKPKQMLRIFGSSIYEFNEDYVVKISKENTVIPLTVLDNEVEVSVPIITIRHNNSIIKVMFTSSEISGQFKAREEVDSTITLSSSINISPTYRSKDLYTLTIEDNRYYRQKHACLRNIVHAIPDGEYGEYNLKYLRSYKHESTVIANLFKRVFKKQENSNVFGTITNRFLRWE